MKGQKNPVVLRDGGASYYQAPGTDLYLIASLSGNSSQKPNVLYQVFKGTGANPIQTGQLKTGETIDVQGAYRLTFEGLAGFSGLQVKKDPGVAVIWLGCGLLLGGLLLAFYWQPLVISGILLSENGKRGNLTVGALAGKTPDSAREALKQFVGSVTKMIS
jgi:cytochrome c biogenesis protein